MALGVGKGDEHPAHTPVRSMAPFTFLPYMSMGRSCKLATTENGITIREFQGYVSFGKILKKYFEME